MVQAIGNQWAAGNTIGDVTISLGANDLFKLAADPGLPVRLAGAASRSMLAQTLGDVAGNYATLLNEVKALLPNAKISLLGEYNPFPADPSNPLNAVAAPAIQALNATIQGLAKQYGADYVDTYSPFVGHEAATPTSRHARQRPPQRPGYAAIAGQIEAVPEPSTLAVLGLGVAALAVARPPPPGPA